MKILHTSDWHLGQKFISKDRIQEHKKALEWLKHTIIEKEIDVLLIAGDIFDIGNPPSYARHLYYQFLKELQNTPCRHTIIIGGNHDSPSMLNAPKELLQMLNVHVVGSATDNIEEEIVVLKNEQQLPELVVAAVPFLRDKDIRMSVAGETGIERIAKIRLGIVQHFEEAGKAVAQYKDHQIPIIAMGHLYAKGATASEKQDNIYIGDIANIEGKQFPTVFDYVALGHLHRAQCINKQKHIRYSGSIIPLSFGEILDKKSIYLLHFNKKDLEDIETIKIPRFRALITVEGALDKIKERLQTINEEKKGVLKPWVEVLLKDEETIPNLDNELRDFAKDFWLELLKVRVHKKHYALEQLSDMTNLDDLAPIEVFEKRCDSAGMMEAEKKKSLLHTFRELQNWMSDKEEL